MALAFFNAPAALFGFGSAAAASSAQDGRPESMSAEAIIKCSDCGGDVVLAQLGEHVCAPPPSDQQQLPPPSSHPPDPPLHHQENPPSKPLQPDSTSLSDPVRQPAPAHPTPLSSSPSSSNGLPITVSSSLRARTSTLSSSTPSTTSSGSSSVNTTATSHSTALTAPSIASPPPTSAPTHHQSPAAAASLNLLKEKLLHSMRPDLAKPASSSSSSSSLNSGGAMSHKSKMTTSSSDLSLDTSDTSSSSNSSSGRLPFFERYAQLTKTATPTKQPASRVTEQQKAVPATRSKMSGTPITSPEPSPVAKTFQQPASQPKLPTSKSMPFSNLPTVGLASQRREALSRGAAHEPRGVPSSSSAASGLDKLIAREKEEPSWNRKADPPASHPSRPSAARQPEQHRPAASASKNLDKAHLPTSSASGLEDLMGDLMAEMSKKAELSSEEYQKRTRHNHPPAVQKIVVPHSTPKGQPFGRPAGDYDYDPRTPRNLRKDPYGDDTPKFQHERHASDPSSHTSSRPSSPGIRPSDSISQLGYRRSPSPKLGRERRVEGGGSVSKVCQRCLEKPIRHVKNPSTDEARFCSPCYAELYLPKCRKCSKPIERGAVTDRVGKVLGKYHASCFNCYQCHAPFPNGEFYVWERKPVCSKHYHRLAGTICCNQSCGAGIEGPCVSLILDEVQVGSSVVSDDSSGSVPISNSARRKLYHPEHFTCSRVGCGTSLHEFHFVVNKLPWCERHALQEEDLLHRAALGLAYPSSSSSSRAPPPPQSSSHRLPSDPRAPPPAGGGHRMARRRTIIQNVRTR